MRETVKSGSIIIGSIVKMKHPDEKNNQTRIGKVLDIRYINGCPEALIEWSESETTIITQEH